MDPQVSHQKPSLKLTETGEKMEKLPLPQKILIDLKGFEKEKEEIKARIHQLEQKILEHETAARSQNEHIQLLINSTQELKQIQDHLIQDKDQQIREAYEKVNQLQQSLLDEKLQNHNHLNRILEENKTLHQSRKTAKNNLSDITKSTLSNNTLNTKCLT